MDHFEHQQASRRQDHDYVARVAIVLLALGVAGGAAADTLSVQWDRSTASRVTAYRVFVGTSSGVYAETFDVPATQTSFVYANAVPGQRYFVAVAAGDGPIWGPLSDEVSDPPVSAAFPILPDTGAPTGPSAPLPVPGPSPFPTDPMPGTPGVYVLASGLAPISALAFSPRGTGLLIEGKRTVRLYDAAGLQAEPALEFDDDVEIEDLALDPQFDLNGRAFVATSRTRRMGDREVSIERHRLLAGALGEAATVVAGLADDPALRTRLALTADGRMIVTAAGTILAFTADGRVPETSTSGTARMGDGPLRPSSIAWDEAAGVVWSTGRDARGTLVVERLEGTGVSRRVTPFPPLPSGTTPDVHSALAGGVAVAPLSSDALVELDAAGRVATRLPVDLTAYGRPVLVAAPSVASRTWYVVLRQTSPDGSTSDTLVRLAARAAGSVPIKQ